MQHRKWHRKRPELSPDKPVHVSIRLLRGTKRLRIRKCFRVVRTALAAVCNKLRFRLIEYSVQNSHLHLIAEADDTFALSRAMRSLSIRIAKGINKLMGARGVRIPDRYSLRVLETPLDVSYALKYVLNNFRKHEAEYQRRCPKRWIDPFSSAIWFEGWTEPPKPARDPCPDLPRGTVPARSASLRFVWKAYDLVDPSFVPGNLKIRAAVAE